MANHCKNGIFFKGHLKEPERKKGGETGREEAGTEGERGSGRGRDRQTETEGTNVTAHNTFP